MSEFTKDQLLEITQEHLPGMQLTGEIGRLSGGNINNVWKAKGKERDLIIKHAPPHIATNPKVSLNDSRIEFEALALSALNNGGSLSEIAKPIIRPPQLYAFDKEHSLIIMEDVSDFLELNQSVLASRSPQKIGELLGRFIGNLHRITFQNEEFSKAFNNLDIQNVRNHLQYQQAADYAGIEDKKLNDEINRRCQDLGNLLLKKGRCLVMGDLWPPSVFVGSKEEIRLIDWEFVHFGRPLQDIGHFAAHCWMQAQIEEATQDTTHWNTIWKSFLQAYKSSAKSLSDDLLDEEERKDISIHIATEILMRTYGPFKAGYLYEGYEDEDCCMKKAKDKAVDFILNAESCRTEFGF